MDPPDASGRHLDASGDREVVYCHQCDNEWYRDERGLECPRCSSTITEIVTPGEDDPRRNTPSPPPLLDHLDDHNPWGAPDSDPEEADIEEHIRQGPNGSTIFTRTTRSAPRVFTTTRTTTRGGADANDPNNIMRDFQDMIGNLMGPGYEPGTAGRSGPDTLFNDFSQPLPGGGGIRGGSFRMGGTNGGPNIVGGRVTFTTTGARATARPYVLGPGGAPFPDDIASIIGNLLGGNQMRNQNSGQPDAMPPMGGLQGLFAAMLNPANARSGDAVYSQEALDQIISTLMEQAPSSNAPGPAPADAIASLPKKKLDEKMLGPEGKGECSVCMDDVHTGDEVVVLPCTHWFHETCAAAWLGEHNTCPICRKGIDAPTSEATPAASTPGTTPSATRRASASGPASRNEARNHRLSRMTSNGRDRNEARLDFIRNGSESGPQNQEERRQSAYDRFSSVPFSPRAQEDYPTAPRPPMPGAFTTRRPSDRESRSGTSGSDRSRESRRNSHSGSGNIGSGGGGGTGPMSWLRDRLGNGRRHDE